MLTRNTHFAIAIHVLTVLAVKGQAVSSSVLAGSVDTNPAFLRVVLGRLREAGLIETERGPAGGSRLARAPEQIALLDVLRAVEGNARLQAHDCSGADCGVARRMPKLLDALSERLDAAMARELEAVTLASVVAGLDQAGPEQVEAGDGARIGGAAPEQ